MAALLIAGLQQPSLDSFLESSDLRQTCTFFLGWVFLYATQYLGLGAARIIEGFCHRNDIPPQVYTESRGEMGHAIQTGVAKRANTRHDYFAAAISMLFALTGLFHFVSLLAFSPPGPGCSFAVAAAGITGGLGKSVGLVALLVELRVCKAKSPTLILIGVCILATIASGLASNGVEVGVLDTVPQSTRHFCVRTYSLPASIVALLLFSITGLLVTVSLLRQVTPDHQRRLEVFLDARMVQSLSLLSLEVLSLPLNVLPRPGVLAQFIPFSLGSLLVIFAFNRKPKVIEAEPAKSFAPVALPPPIRVIDLSQPSPKHLDSLDIPNHPYATTEKGESPRTARSSRTIDSDYAQSVQAAVVQIAFRKPRWSKIPGLPAGSSHGSPLNPDVTPAVPASPTMTSRTERQVRALSALLVHPSPQVLLDGRRIHDRHSVGAVKYGSPTALSRLDVSRPSSVTYPSLTASPVWQWRRTSAVSSAGAVVEYPISSERGPGYV